MHYLDESHILLFLVQVLVILGCARTLSIICESFKIPAIAGDILAGILLGPTLLGRVAPSLQVWLFPMDQVQSIMLETVSWLGVFLLVLWQEVPKEYQTNFAIVFPTRYMPSLFHSFLQRLVLKLISSWV